MERPVTIKIAVAIFFTNFIFDCIYIAIDLPGHLNLELAERSGTYVEMFINIVFGIYIWLGKLWARNWYVVIWLLTAIFNILFLIISSATDQPILEPLVDFLYYMTTEFLFICLLYISYSKQWFNQCAAK